jgi:hypothetical protein
MSLRDALSRVLLTYENNLKCTDDDGKVARARVLERVIQGKLESGTDSGEADAAGASNGIMQYQNNPGSSDASRSAAALTAKGNLIARGWTITIA